MAMSYIDVAIPGIFGFLCRSWPEIFFAKGKEPDPERIRLLRRIGNTMLLVAAGYLVMTIFGV